ncbi:efflux RND transporter periplasmic adaptor subunit [Ramlibacter sp.]|uniref:efflux RND transporter periplasmic adaptor subunit n=1 Tax=Ramlibacter sp. TaxID=1917967 RepID=UPI002D26573D|nr:efflux RND transporter periplasmic adaptor subunit [Ramlibacter sp.]HYD75309.1 efflux RND transporter periplasmic adaptor subunit [Ramlibacter sp.]
MKRSAMVAAAVVVAALVAASAFYAGRMSASPAPAAAGSTSPPPGERKVLYWHDPMVPGPRFDKPGKSPFMDMQLVPVYADEANESGVTVSPGVQQNLGIRTAPVRKAQIAPAFDAVGAVQFDERRTVAVQTRVAGYVERLAVRAPMERVRKGQVLATLYAPDWLAPLNELVALQRAGASQELVLAARERTRALSIPQDLVRQAEAGGSVTGRYTLTAPAGGVVAELGVREGVAVSPGMSLFRIAGLDKVWAVAEIPETHAVRLVRGQKVSAALQADPGQAFAGELKEILPEVSATTRTLKARFEVDNRGGKLMPGMLLRIRVEAPATERLVVPAEAVIRTGTRAVAIVRKQDGTFQPREVKLGVDLGDQLEIARGLNEGDEVVASGQFLVDSEARLRSVLDGMAAVGSAVPAASAPSTATPAPAAKGVYRAEGKVESVEPDGITISHGPVPELRWPAMTMGFGKPDPKAFSAVKPGDMVRFEFKQGGAMGYELVNVQPSGAGK